MVSFFSSAPLSNSIRDLAAVQIKSGQVLNVASSLRPASVTSVPGKNSAVGF